MLGARGGAARTRRRVSFINNDKVRCIGDETVALRLRFDEVYASNNVRIVLINRDVGPRQLTLQSSDLRRLYEHDLNRELFSERARPLITEVGRTPRATDGRKSTL
jgi:hypothetical protein